MHRLTLAAAALALVACSGSSGADAQNEQAALTPVDTERFATEVIADFDEPWAMAFLPDGRLVVTEKPGTMHIVDLAASEPRIGTITGIPEVDYGDQGGLGDVRPHPDFASNRLLYFSYAEAGDRDTRGGAVARGRLVCAEAISCTLEDIEVIWHQTPKVTGRGHFSYRIQFDDDGFLWISSGDRQKLAPAQDLSNTLGTVVRLDEDGRVPEDNPFADRGGVTAQIWSYGHRNPLGLAFDPEGRLWVLEHGPAGGDELNLVERGGNYGWPLASDGDNYDGEPIPDHRERPQFHAPAISWTPVIAPGSLIFYTGDMFPWLSGRAIAAGMAANALVFIEIDGERARETGRYAMGARIRSVVQGPEGALWVLEDERDGSQGRLIRLTSAG